MIKTKRLKGLVRDWQYHRSRTTPIYYLSRRSATEEQINEFIDWCLTWCEKNLGKTKNGGTPEVEWQWNDRWYQKHKLLALYDREDKLIDLRIQGHRTIYHLASTIVHEWVHYLQPTAGNWYERWDKQVGYWKNPYEIEAHYIGDLYGADCALWAVNQMKQKGRGRGRKLRPVKP